MVKFYKVSAGFWFQSMVLAALQKTFGKINRKILLDEPLPIEFSENTISWYESYLAERHFTVELQVSILDPRSV